MPLYFAKERPIVWRDGTMIMVDDDRLPLKPGEKPEMRRVRFRTLGCYPLTGAVDSNATTLPEIIQEMLLTKIVRAARPADRPRPSRVDGEEEEGRVFLNCDIVASMPAARCGGRCHMREPRLTINAMRATEGRHCAVSKPTIA